MHHSEHDKLLEHPWILRTYAPVYVMRFPQDPDDSTLDMLCAVRERWARHAKHPCAWVADMSQLTAMPSAKQRRNPHVLTMSPPLSPVSVSVSAPTS